MLISGFLLLNVASLVNSLSEGTGGSPENITVHTIDPQTVEVFWSSVRKNVERFDVTYNPAESSLLMSFERVVTRAAGNTHSVILRELRPDTQYQVTVTAVIDGKSYRSRRFIFKTAHSAAPDKIFASATGSAFGPTKATDSEKFQPPLMETVNPDPTAIGSKYTPQTSTTVRGVEIGLVLLALVVWIIAIALFFRRWGKIRMLLPYQPDYKTQQSLKVPGTGTTMISSCTGNRGRQGQQEGPGCVQHLRWSSPCFDERTAAKKARIPKWASRPRVTSAVFPSSPPPTYARTSAECDSPKMIRHTRSRDDDDDDDDDDGDDDDDFPVEGIPSCQSRRQQRDHPPNQLAIEVPVISGSINERVQKNKKVDSQKPGGIKTCSIFDNESMIKSRRSERTENVEHYVRGHDVNLCEYVLKVDELHGLYQSERDKKNSADFERDEAETEPDYLNKSRQVRDEESEKSFENIKLEPVLRNQMATRYSRSSFKKQKMRFCDDRNDEDSKNENETNDIERNTEGMETEVDKGKKIKELKTAEMKRRTLIRKISLQDTYLNYNQDYWLDFRKSERFHNSVDLGYFGNENCKNMMTEPRMIDKEVQTLTWAEHDRDEDASKRLEQNLPSKEERNDGMNRSDGVLLKSTPKRVITEISSFTDVDEFGVGSPDILMEVVDKRSSKESTEAEAPCFFLSSNENIPLFSERNGLIETDFDVFDESHLPSNDSQTDSSYRLTHKTEKVYTDVRHDDVLCLQIDFTDFYEIKLNGGGSDSSIKNCSSVFE